PDDGAAIALVSAIPATQETSFPNNAAFLSTAVERALDKLTRIVIQLLGRTLRTVRLADDDPTEGLDPLPGTTARASRVLGFDAEGKLTTTLPLGTFRGTWAASTEYTMGDSVKDPVSGDLYVAVAASAFTSGADSATDLADTDRWA